MYEINYHQILKNQYFVNVCFESPRLDLGGGVEGAPEFQVLKLQFSHSALSTGNLISNLN